MNIKRGKILIFNNRKGISHDLFFNVFELILAFIVILALLNFVSDVAEQTLYKKNFLARDISLLINALYTAPTKVDYTYEEDMQELIFEFSKNRINIYKEGEEDDVNVFYIFGEDTIASFSDPYPVLTYGKETTRMKFVKVSGKDSGSMNVEK